MPTGRHYLEAELYGQAGDGNRIIDFLKRGSLDGLWYWDLENPEHEWMSPRFWELFGFDPASKKHLASEWQDLIFKEDLEVALDNFQKHCADPDHPYDQIVRYRHADGSTVHVRCRGMAIRDEAGVPIRMLGVHYDYTALMTAQSDLQSTVMRLSTVLETATNGIIGLDGDKRVLEINAAARDMLGLSGRSPPFDWPGDITFLHWETLRPQIRSADPVERLLSGQAIRNEIHLMWCGGEDSEAYVQISGNSIGDATSPIKSVLILDDITDAERNRQQAERANRLDALGQLTGGIAHDFNNLLATVQYALQIALNGALDESNRKFLETAWSCVRRGAKLTNRLLSFAKRQTGNVRTVRLDTLFAEFEGLASPTIEATIQLTFSIQDPELTVQCDHSQLENALLNLVLNARDAILGSGRGDRIRIAARRAPMHRPDPDGDGEVRPGLIELSVSDNGPGMPAEVRRRAADPFFSTKKDKGGSGLGLTMVYGLIQQFDGSMRVNSEPDLGTTVLLYLPEGDVERVETGDPKLMPATASVGLKILVVEDEAELLTMIDQLLRILGYDVIVAPSGKQALDMAHRGDAFDILLTDIIMPGGTGGFELAMQLRERRPGLAVVFMSGYAGLADADSRPINAPFVQKPAHAAELVAAINKALTLAGRPEAGSELH